MKALYVFNPENDMALAYGGPYYMPPVNAKKMAADLSALPMWYALPDSDVWLADGRQVKWMNKECPLLLPVCGVTEPSYIYNKVYPWGWSSSMTHRLLMKNVDGIVCPSDSRIERIRELSARGVAGEMLQKLRLPGTIGESFVFASAEEVEVFVRSYDKVLLKAPWSGSGRGIQSVEGKCDQPLKGWVNRLLKTQGYLVGEPFYDKEVDFAMEFLVGEEGVSFAGYSLFETDTRGIYKENLLALDTQIEHRLSTYIPNDLLLEVRYRLEKLLTDIIGDAYQGYLGIDMMVCRSADGYVLHPCVEMNLRMNMGITSRLLYDRYVMPGQTGRFVIEFYPNRMDALRTHETFKREYPLWVETNKIRQGYLSLTPVFEDTAYQAYVIIN